MFVFQIRVDLSNQNYIHYISWQPVGNSLTDLWKKLKMLCDGIFVYCT